MILIFEFRKVKMMHTFIIFEHPWESNVKKFYTIQCIDNICTVYSVPNYDLQSYVD